MRAEEKKRKKFTAVFEHHGKWWIAYGEDVPGVNTQCHTLAEARSNLQEAVHLVIEANREIARRQAKCKRVVLP